MKTNAIAWINLNMYNFNDDDDDNVDEWGGKM